MKLFIPLLFAFIFVGPLGDGNFMQDKSSRKKIDKAITSFFKTDNYRLEPLKLSIDRIFEVEDQEMNEAFYKIVEEDKLIGLLYSGSAKGRYDWFDFIVILNPEKVIEKVEIIVYRSDHGYEIMNKSWLSQFQGTTGCDLKYGKDIDAISGATLSAGSLTNAIADLCLKLNEIELLTN